MLNDKHGMKVRYVASTQTVLKRIKLHPISPQCGWVWALGSAVAALLVSISLKSLPSSSYRVWTSDKLIPTSTVHPFRSNVIDFDSEPSCWAGRAFDYVHYSVPRKVLDDIVEDLGFGQVRDYRVAVLENDLVVAQITKASFRSLGGATFSLGWLWINSALSWERILSSSTAYSRKQQGLPRGDVHHGRRDEPASFFTKTCMAASGSLTLHANADSPSATLRAHSKPLSAPPLTSG
jgi:hypothetical protein